MKKIILAGGGLGNQLFAWSFAHYINVHENDSIEILISENEFSQLEKSIIKLQFFCSEKIEIKSSFFIKYFLRFFDWLNLHFKFNFLFKRYKIFFQSDNLWDTPDSTCVNYIYFRGFFQNITIVESTKTQVYSELNELIDNIFCQPAVDEFRINSEYQFIHIRRGDYVLNSDHYGLLSFDYYKKNMRDDLIAYVSCDDINLRDQIAFAFPQAIFLSPDRFDTWTTFAIMSRAKYLLMANSTLSWWAGNLVVENGGVAVMPTPWFQAVPEVTNYLVNPKFKLSSSIFLT